MGNSGWMSARETQAGRLLLALMNVQAKLAANDRATALRQSPYASAISGSHRRWWFSSRRNRAMEIANTVDAAVSTLGALFHWTAAFILAGPALITSLSILVRPKPDEKRDYVLTVISTTKPSGSSMPPPM